MEKLVVDINVWNLNRLEIWLILTDSYTKNKLNESLHWTTDCGQLLYGL